MEKSVSDRRNLIVGSESLIGAMRWGKNRTCHTGLRSRRSDVINQSHCFTFQKKLYYLSLTLLYVPEEAMLLTLIHFPEEAILFITHTALRSRRSGIINNSHCFIFQKKRYYLSLTMFYVPEEAILFITYTALRTRRSYVINHSHCFTFQKRRCY